jgi:hypothetical protein
MQLAVARVVIRELDIAQEHRQLSRSEIEPQTFPFGIIFGVTPGIFWTRE